MKPSGFLRGLGDVGKEVRDFFFAYPPLVAAEDVREGFVAQAPLLFAAEAFGCNARLQTPPDSWEEVAGDGRKVFLTRRTTVSGDAHAYISQSSSSVKGQF